MYPSLAPRSPVINGVKYMVYARTTDFDRFAVHSQLKISYVSPLFRDCLKVMWPMGIALSYRAVRNSQTL